MESVKGRGNAEHECCRKKLGKLEEINSFFLHLKW